ncbi:MAG: hypothetical protein IJM97_08445, partial [Clostridia bacterium]|nr:hypothetical protein [Clostridia bacterium]
MKYELTLSSTNGSHILYGDSKETATTIGDHMFTSLDAGTKVYVNAVLIEGQDRTFMYWKDQRGRIVSYSPEYEFVLEADREMIAVYSEDKTSGYHTVVFVDTILKTVIDEQQVENGKGATAPTIEQKHGEYTFLKWDKTFDNVTESFIVSAVYALSTELFTITTVIDGVSTEEKYRYNAPVVLTVSDEQLNGRNFAGWTIDGETVISYSRTYKFYAYKDMTVTALFVDKEVEAGATVVLVTAVKEKTDTTYKAEFMVIRDVPENCVFISSGLLLTQSAEMGTNEKLTFESETIEGQTAIRLYRTVHTDPSGQYQLTVKTSAGKTFYARGFLVYMDTNGNIITVYTDVQSVTA